MASASPFSAFPLIGPTAERPLQQAFVLRLSEDSLDALRELMMNDHGEGMELELGLGETLLHIPNQPSFTLTPAELNPSTEFVSHPSPSSPYFLHSSASTRYTIRQTTVSAATKNKLRLGTEQAAKDKAERRIVQLDHEPVKSKGGKGKQAAASTSSSSSLNKDGLPAHMRSKPLSSGSAGSGVGSRGSSPAGRMGGGALTPGGSPAMSSSGGTIRAGSRDGSNPLRTRIIQLLAMGPLSSRDLVAKVKSREEDVIEVLNVVAKPPSASRLYQLQPKSFLELDIFGWKAYSRADREKVVAATLHAFDVDLRLPKDAPERRILDPDFVKSPAKPAYATSALGQSHSGSYGLGLGVGLGVGSGSKRSASPLPPASPADDSGSTSSGSTLPLKSKKGAAVVVEKGKKKVSLSTSSSAGVASKRKDRDDDDDDEDGEISEPKPSKSSSSITNGNGSSSSQDHSKRRRTIDASSLLLASNPSGSSSSLKHSTSSTSLNKSLLSASHTKSHLSISSSSNSLHVPTPYSSRPSTPLIPDQPPPSSSHHSRRKASPTFTSSSGSSTTSSSPSSSRSSSPHQPLDLPDSPGALRKRFKSLWPEYDLLNESLGREKERSEGILAGRVGGAGGGKSLKEVKGEVRRRRVIHRELEEIKGRLGRRAKEGGKGK